jgi:hypothetical protein
MEPLKPDTKRSILQSNPQADPADIEEYERLLAEMFTVDPSIQPAPTSPAGIAGISAQQAREARLTELHRKLFRPASGVQPNQ